MSEPDQIPKQSVLHKQLTISLKFHHSETLKQLPLETALRSMVEAWNSCHPETQQQLHSKTLTEIVSATDLAKLLDQQLLN
ncbi:MAG: hypothetical protein HC851_24755 [Acaryochloris sp. RU_4_1]|nr:hypothetical protein [Acaryochloris sp. RU_4_1]